MEICTTAERRPSRDATTTGQVLAAHPGSARGFGTTRVVGGECHPRAKGSRRTEEVAGSGGGRHGADTRNPRSTREPEAKKPLGPSPSGGERIETTGGHLFGVISGEDLDKRHVPEHCPAEVPNAAIPGRWVNAIALRVGDILFTRDGRRMPVTNVLVRHVKMKVYNLQVAELENQAIGYSGIFVQNTSGNPTPQGRWQWTPSRATPQPPRPGGTAPQGDIPELIQHLGQIRGQGATIAEAEQAWVDGMRLIDQRAARFPGNGPVVNDFYGVVGGEWSVYVGRPAIPGKDTFAIAFNSRTGAIAQGYYPSGIRPHPTQTGQEALFNFKIIHP